MTQPLNYTVQFPPGRPTSVTVVAVFGIIIGGFLSLCTPFSLIPFFVNLGVPNPFIDAVKADPALFGWTIFSTVVNWGFAILLLTCSIASLSLKEWARKGMLGWAVAALAMTLVGTILNFLWLFPKMRELGAGAGGGTAEQVGQWVGLGIGLFIGVALPLATLYFYTRPHVTAAFAAPGTYPAA